MPGLGVNAFPIIIPNKIAIRTVDIGLLGVPKISIANKLFIPCENKQNTSAKIKPGNIAFIYWNFRSTEIIIKHFCKV